MKTISSAPDLELAFDVGHSSIGWAVLQSTGASSAATAPRVNILGCGVVTFGADDCLARKRRDYRRQRRHARSTRQRIAHMEKLLTHLKVLSADQFKQKHQQAGGDSAPWLLAARVLSARTEEEKNRALLNNWSELWDVLRWYAHNRGYDGNQRWSNREVIQAFSTEGLHQNAKPSSEDESRLVAAAERADAEAGIQNETDSDVKKVKEAFKQMHDYGTQTMAETMTKHIAKFEKEAAEYRQGNRTEKPTRFKGLGAAFPRRITRAVNGQRTLVGGVEWEVRFILRAHFGHLPSCDAVFERATCGNLPETKHDWRAYETSHPNLYLTSNADKLKLRSLFISRKADKQTKELKKKERANFLFNKLVLSSHYEGGLLFGQSVPRFENRIIAKCPITRGKVPGKHCHEFLEFRWAMTLANIRVGLGHEQYEDNANLRPLTTEELYKVDARVRRLGFLKLEPDKPGKDGFVRPGKNELRTIVVAETKCDRHNLDTLLLHPDSKEGLKLLPAKGDTAAFRVVWGSFGDPAHDAKGCYHDDVLRHRFTTQLLRGTKENPKKLTIQKIFDELNRLKKCDVAERLLQAAKQEAQGKKVKLDSDKLNALLSAEFYCDKLKGRARFSRDMLSLAVQQIFQKPKPIHPLEKGGCLEQTEKIKRAALEKPLDQQTNNHLVRHRLLILKRLHDHIIHDFAGADKSRISHITVEVARDLQTMSGMTNKDKAKELTGKLKHHHEIAAGLAEKLKDERDENGHPFAISPGLIRKARIADDLKWECPYTGHLFEPAFLVHRSYDKDHVIPRSKRLSDALEALVITSREVNGEKKARTALQFVKEMSQSENCAKRDRLGIRTEAQFRTFVDSLWPKSDPFKRARAGGNRATDDEARCWRRKQLLLTETWEEKEFTPADLTKTRYITKLAAQQLEASFKDLSELQRPAVISITGAVTAAFRDKSWKLLPLLGSANSEITKLHAQKIEAEKTGRDFNFKKAVRGVTHLHHALDAMTLGLIAALLVPLRDGRAGLNGDLARLIHKGKLTAEERNQFEAIRNKLGLPKFYQWSASRCDAEDKPRRAAGQAWTLCIDELSESIKRQICERLTEKRIVQHIPADMSGLKVEENTRGVVRVQDGRVYLRQQKRDEKTGKLAVNFTEEAVGKALGLKPVNGAGELATVNGVRVISDNFGVAILDHAAQGEDKFEIVPHHKIWPRIFKGLNGGKSLVERNSGNVPRVLRNGQIIEVLFGTYKGRWRVFSIKNKKAGLKVNLGTLDCLEVEFDTVDPETGKKCSRTTPGCKLDAALETIVAGGLQILKTRLTGTRVNPTPSA